MSTASASTSASTLARESHGFDPRRRLLRRDRPGPGAGARQADRRALGHRPGRLPARQLPAGLGGVERPATATACARFWKGDAAQLRRRWRRA